MENIVLLRKFLEEFEKNYNIGLIYKLTGIHYELKKNKFYEDIDNKERFFILLCIDDMCLLSGLKTRRNICKFIKKGSQIINDFIYLYYKLSKIQYFCNFELDRKFSLFLSIFIKLINYRERKCISLNSRQKETSLYKNIIRRYINKYIKKAKKNNSYIRESIDLWKLFEEIKIKSKKVDDFNMKKITDEICPVCSNYMIYNMYYLCESCNFMKFMSV